MAAKRLRSLLLGALLSACAPPPPAILSPQGSTVRVGPAPAASACDLTLRVAIHPDPGDTFAVTVVAENSSSRPLDFDLDPRCPGGIVDLVGLGAGYDYYSNCAAGACPGTSGAKHVHLEVRGRETLASTTILARGGSCTAPLPPGRHSIQAVAPPLDLTVCSEAAIFDVHAAPVVTTASPIAPPIVPPPAPARPAIVAPPALANAECTSSADCVLDCPTPPGCCGWACGCKNAIPRARVASFEADYAKTCTHPPHCLAMGCAYEPAVMAVCVNGRCAPSSGLTAPAMAPVPGH